MAKNSDVTWITSENARRAKSAVAVTVSFALLMSALGIVSWLGYGYYMDWRERDDYIGTGEAPIQIVVEAGLGWGKVADILLVKDVIKDPVLFQREALALAEGPSPGTWNLMTHLPAATAAEMLLNTKNRLELRLTIPEGLRLVEIFPIMIKELGVSQDEIDQAIETIKADPTVIGLDAAAGDVLEGFLFPDTYYLYPPIDTDALSVFEKMAKQFSLVADEIDLEKKAKALGISMKQAVTVASIIDAEVFRDDDRPKVARVIFNRLKIKMRLELDTTVNYGLDRTGHVVVTKKEQEQDTPYNTYMHSGLPPTAINCPGKDSLEAAVNPAKGGWLFFTTVDLNTGETRFENTYEEHLENVEVLGQWCRDNPGMCQ